MTKNTILSILLLFPFFSTIASSDVGVDGVVVISNDLGYKTVGYGVQLDADGEHNNWGWDIQATALRHGKWLADGERYQVIATGRRFFGDFFVEVGGEWGGYESRFPDGVVWEKYGYSAVAGVGTKTEELEVTVRYFFPDTTFNNTSVISTAAEIPLADDWVVGSSLEYWRFDIGQERLDGYQVTFEIGYRF